MLKIDSKKLNSRSHIKASSGKPRKNDTKAPSDLVQNSPVESLELSSPKSHGITDSQSVSRPLAKTETNPQAQVSVAQGNMAFPQIAEDLECCSNSAGTLTLLESPVVQVPKRATGPDGTRVVSFQSPQDPRFKEYVKNLPQDSVLRIINSQFIDTALETGTDKGYIESNDVRSAGKGTGAGFDVWGVESGLKERGLTKADVFCGSPKPFFVESDLENYKTEGLGLPTDRSAILIFDGKQVKEISETDGFEFRKPEAKRDALLGVIRFQPQYQPFELEMRETNSLDRKVDILEREVAGMKHYEGSYKRSKLISTLITNLAYENPDSPARKDLLELSGTLRKRLMQLEKVDSLQDSVDIYLGALASKNPRRIAGLASSPAFAKRQAQKALRENPDTPEEFAVQLRGIIAQVDALGLDSGSSKSRASSLSS